MNRKLLIALALCLVLGSCWYTCEAQDVVSRRVVSGVVQYTVYDTVDADNRDGYSTPGNEALSHTTGASYVGDDGPGVEDVGYLFVIPIAQGKTIDSAFIYVYKTGYDSGMDSDDTLQWAGYDVDDADVFDAGHTHMLSEHHALTDARVLTVPTGTGSAGWMKSPDLKTIVQEIVDRAGWTSSADMGFVLFDKSVTSGHDFGVEDYTVGGNNAYIVIYYR